MIKRSKFLNQLIDFKDKDLIKVITGIRRCGKSSLMEMFEEYLKSQNIKEDNILKINFESLNYMDLTYKELYELIKEKVQTAEGKLYLLFDEIQKIDKWEYTINSARVDFDCDIYITGSNAYLLSSQLATYLSGRYVEIKMQPLSFREFLTFYNLENKTKEEKFELYLKYGSMPGLRDLNFNHKMIEQTLDSIYSTVIMKDVINQVDIRDFSLLEKIVLFLADNIGNYTSTNKLKDTLISKNAITKGTTQGIIDNYIHYLKNAFIFYDVKRYDIKGKEYLKTQGKYYIIDTGLRNFLLGFKDKDRGHILENIVFLELKNRGYNISIGKINDKEIDFIAQNPDEKIYIQVTQTLMDERVRQREIAPLKMIKDNYEKIILTSDTLFTNTDDEGIKILNLIDWLLA